MHLPLLTELHEFLHTEVVQQLESVLIVVSGVLVGVEIMLDRLAGGFVCVDEEGHDLIVNS